MTCVTTPMFSLMLNGSLTRFFGDQRGLRQIDHMSPLLFPLCMVYVDMILCFVSKRGSSSMLNARN